MWAKQRFPDAPTNDHLTTKLTKDTKGAVLKRPPAPSPLTPLPIGRSEERPSLDGLWGEGNRARLTGVCPSH